MKKFIILFILLCLLVSTLALFVLSQKASFFFDETETEISISKGTSIKKLAHKLKEENIILSETLFYLLARQSNAVIKAGVYSVSNTLSVLELLDLFAEGRDSQIRITIPEGFTLTKLAKLLEANNITSYEEFMRESQNQALLDRDRKSVV